MVTFWPHPRAVLQQDARDFRLLTSLDEKKQLLMSLGVDRVEVLPFTRSFASLTASEYLSLLQDRFGASVVVMGYDNRIGSDRKTVDELRVSSAISCPEQHGAYCSPNPSSLRSSSLPTSLRAVGSLPFMGPRAATGSEDQYAPCSIVPVEAFGNTSSTKIRRALSDGLVGDAAAMLGYNYGLQGVVVAGNRLGRTIGFPTANMQLYEPLKLVPLNGVYAVEVEVLGSTYRGMCNIGTRPTVGGVSRTIETHILDFSEDIYGLPIGLRFLRRIRDERLFPSLDALRAQLLQDRTACSF